MKAFLLAAGHGTRLRPLTETVPKCLLPIRDVPILELWLRQCARAGINEVLVNVHSHADAVQRYVAERDPSISVVIVEEKVLLGSAGTLKRNRAWVAGEREFWIIYADVLTSMDLNAMLEYHRRAGQHATLAVKEVEDPHRCGIIVHDENGIIREFEEKPSNPRSRLAFTGIMIGSPDMIEEIPDKLPCDIGFDVLPQLVGRMCAYPIADFLLDIGTMRNYQLAQSTWRPV